MAQYSIGADSLGLNIVYNMVTGLLGGDIHVQSEPGEGTRFILDLPLQAPERSDVDAKRRVNSQSKQP